MVTTLFGDKIITATDLKKNQKSWFAKAVKTPISITLSGGRQFVLINRDQIHNLILIKDYSEKIARYCSEMKTEEASSVSNVFPWATELSEEDRKEFREELINSFLRLVEEGDAETIEEVISSWEATSEALKNDKFMEVINDPETNHEYVDVE